MRLPIRIWSGQAATGSCLFFPLLFHPALVFVPLPWFPAEFHCSRWSSCCHCYPMPVSWLPSLIFSRGHMLCAASLQDLLSPLTLVFLMAPHLISLFLQFTSTAPSLLPVELFLPSLFLLTIPSKLRWLSQLGSGFIFQAWGCQKCQTLPGMGKKWRGRGLNLGLRPCLCIGIITFHWTFKNKAGLS